MVRRLSLLLFAAALIAGADDNLIVPGVRVGPVTRASTERTLLAQFGKAAVKQKVDIGEGVEEPGLVLYPADATRRLEIVWTDETPPHPATVFLCRATAQGPCRWHTPTGIGFGTTLKDLERRNSKPFEMVVWGSDVGGNLTSFQGGTLERELHHRGLFLSLFPRIDKDGAYLPKLTDEEMNAVRGEKFVLSSDPVLQKLNPTVGAMRVQFDR